MKLILLMIFSTSLLFSNYNFNGQNMGKIDMHGGKGDKLELPKVKNLNNLNMMQLGLPKKPIEPTKIEIEEKQKKKNEGKSK
jgi:hypothetical protein